MTDLVRVYLDTNVFIAAMENPGAHSHHAWWIMDAVDEGEIAAVTSEITLAEVLVKPIEMGETPLADAYEKMIVSEGHFEVIPIRRDILLSAARLRAKRRSIRLPDAIHIATALAAGCSHVVSNDQRLHSIDGVRTLSVNPFTLDDIFADEK